MVLVLVLLVCFGAAQEQGHVLAGLGAGVKGSAVFVASAEMMRGEGASFLLEAARMQARELLFKVRSELRQYHADEFVTRDEALEIARKPLVLPDVPGAEPLLRRIVAMVTPKMNDTHTAVHDLLHEILRMEHNFRKSIDKVRASVQERQQHVSARHAFLLQELVAVDLATKLNDGLVMRQALGVNATQEQFRKLSHKHDRLYAQITRVARRLMAGEMRAQRVAGRLVTDLVINKIAVLESVISRVMYRMLSVYNRRGAGAPQLLAFLEEMVAELDDMEEEQGRLFSTSGALLSALAVSNERTIETLVSEMLNITNKTVTPEDLEVYEAFDIAVARRNARVFIHRAIRTMEALFEKNPISDRADAIRRVTAVAAHRLFKAEQVAVEGRVDRQSYFASKASDFDLEALVFGTAKKTNVTVPSIDTRDFLRLSRSIDDTMDADALGIVNLTAVEEADEEPIHKGDVEHAVRLSYDLMRLLEGEAAHYRAGELLEQGKRTEAITNLTKAEQLLSEFLQPHPDASTYRENVDLDGDPIAPELARKIFSNKRDMEKHMLNQIQSSVISSKVQRRGKPVPWGKFGHHAKLRKRIFRNGVAVERDELPKFLSPSRYRLDRLERALKGANLQFSRNSMRRMDGIGEGEDRLAHRIVGKKGRLMEGTENRFEDDEMLAQALKEIEDRTEAERDRMEQRALNTAFDVAATGQLSDVEGDVVKIPKKFLSVRARENVGGKNGFNQFARANSKLGVNKVQGFKTQVNKAKLASKIHLKRVKNAAKSMSASIKKLAKDGRAAIKSIVSATAKKVTSTASAIRKLAEEGRIARKAAERKRKRLVKDARALVSNVRDKLKTSLDNVKQAVTLTASSIAKDSIFVGRAKDANKALQNIVLGELRKSRSGIVQVATGLAQMGGLVPGKVGQQLASIGARARNLFIPGAVGQRIGQITGQIQNIANKIGSARKTVDQIGSVLKNIRKKGIKGALKSLLKSSSTTASPTTVSSSTSSPNRMTLASAGPVGWAIGGGSALVAFGPAISRAVGKATKAVADFLSCVVGCSNERRARRLARRKAKCNEWISSGRWKGQNLKDLPEIAARDWLCRNDVVPPVGDVFRQGSLEQAIATREVCGLWHRAGTVAVVGRSCVPSADRLFCNQWAGMKKIHRGAPCPRAVKDELTCTAGSPFAPNPETQCGPRTPESIVFALKRMARCVAWQRNGTWTSEPLSPEQQNLFGRGLFFRHELDAEWNCGKRQPAIAAALK